MMGRDDMSMQFGLVSDGPKMCGRARAPPLASDWGGREEYRHAYKSYPSLVFVSRPCPPTHVV